MENETALVAITPMEVMTKAVEGGANIETLERLMALQERWEGNEARKAFANAMANVRKKLPSLTKDQEVDFTTSKGRTNYKYESLSSIIEAISEPLASEGLSFRWRTDSKSTPGYVEVTCIIEHKDGHFEETSLNGPYDQSGGKNAIQAVGSVTSFLQRYTLKAAVGMASSRDDDGQGSPQKAPQQTPPPQQEPPPPQESMSAEETANIAQNFLNEINKAFELKLMTQERVDKAIEWADGNTASSIKKQSDYWEYRNEVVEMIDTIIDCIQKSHDAGTTDVIDYDTLTAKFSAFREETDMKKLPKDLDKTRDSWLGKVPDPTLPSEKSGADSAPEPEVLEPEGEPEGLDPTETSTSPPEPHWLWDQDVQEDWPKDKDGPIGESLLKFILDYAEKRFNNVNPTKAAMIKIWMQVDQENSEADNLANFPYALVEINTTHTS